MSENTQTSSSGDSPIDVDEFMTASYLIPARKSVVELLETDKEDESLRKYKETLLPLENGPVIVDPNNPNNVIVKKISLVVDGEVKHSMDLPASTDFTFSIKEGCTYKIRFEFFVQREIVSGLKYLHKVSRLGIGVTRECYMLGSFGPREEIYCCDTSLEEAPSGLISRGKYRVRSLISDDDKNRWLEWSWNIDIDKNW
ncbi:hypothetical protein Mgra_00007837 [Meloidogyne graminicola]|uniref:Rho GDP dissociation inhibitor n=1 Tax=Meloidogyne graminicola TaxID=189291 RepID=A0A8S9ZHK6_9BILA|nr:hypothetical protein Mgra_00007837 [Meloidogyne graminicola]